ncbi:MAG: GNAT family N-acetyltransferase [Anaerolineae bacterium]
MAIGELRVTRQQRLDAPSLRRLRDIYYDSFPPSERDNFDELMVAIAQGLSWLFTASLDGNLVGFAIAMPIADSDAALLDYFAIARKRRNQGLGAAFLRKLADQFRATSDTSGLLLEVESDEWGTEEERQLRRRRIGFYRRNGARLVAGLPPLRVPSMADDSTLEVKLMWLPLWDEAAEPFGGNLRECVVALYATSYSLPATHPLVQEALAKGVGVSSQEPGDSGLHQRKLALPAQP